jgi:16S rRNA (cytosine1402-N4)-methyltransferase
MHQERQNQEHIPVLLEQVLQYLDPKEGEKYLDLTGGYGGHAKAILERTKAPSEAILVDRDPAAVKSLTAQFAKKGVSVMQADFLTASKKLVEEGKQFNLILADLGVSSPHLNLASRGFSIQKDGPLDMRMDTTQELTAETIVNTFPQDKLEKIFRHYGEEPKARAVAKKIIDNRPIKTTTELASLIAKVWPGHSKVHPATRAFQALRVAVNNELELLEMALPLWIGPLLAPGGRLVVISFHSLEDRIVKNGLKEFGSAGYDAILNILTKQPITGQVNELVFNPRARSAKLRAALKQK